MGKFVISLRIEHEIDVDNPAEAFRAAHVETGELMRSPLFREGETKIRWDITSLDIWERKDEK